LTDVLVRQNQAVLKTAHIAVKALLETQAALQDVEYRCAGLETENEFLRSGGKLPCSKCGGEKELRCVEMSLASGAAREGKVGIMPFDRPKPAFKLGKADRQALVKDYFAHYRQIAEQDAAGLNPKLPRAVFQDLLGEIGAILLAKSRELADQPGPLRNFLVHNQLPGRLSEFLPDDFRAFCLALNALKQWVAKEQAATDRYLLGGRARTECREAATTCIVTGEPLTPDRTELHHPVRDGRPPIPLSKQGHAALEKQGPSAGGDSIRSKLFAIKRQSNRSWVHLRRGCLDLLGQNVNHSTPKVGASSRAFAKKASLLTELGYQELLALLDEWGL
jgi:hypothetical protein